MIEKAYTLPSETPNLVVEVSVLFVETKAVDETRKIIKRNATMQPQLSDILVPTATIFPALFLLLPVRTPASKIID